MTRLGENAVPGSEPPMIEPEWFASWILREDEEFLVLDKPGFIVCHPSKNGPWSSLVGAAREHTGLEKSHLIFRLDRETSGVVVFAKHARLAARLQKAIERRRVKKTYFALLSGEVTQPTLVDQPLGPEPQSVVTVKQRVVAADTPGAQTARTEIIPLRHGGGITLALVRLHTGRKHQIRAHALWLGHPVAGDKLYGPDETLYLEFARFGWTERHAALLPLTRQALHAWKIEFTDLGEQGIFVAPPPADLVAFAKPRLGIEAGGWLELAGRAAADHAEAFRETKA